jgi:hypothetical protein
MRVATSRNSVTVVEYENNSSSATPNRDSGCNGMVEGVEQKLCIGFR